MNVVTSPVAMAYGRRFVPLLPPASTIGSTGRMHGVNAVRIPAANAIGIRTGTSSSRGYDAGVSAGDGFGFALGFGERLGFG